MGKNRIAEFYPEGKCLRITLTTPISNILALRVGQTPEYKDCFYLETMNGGKENMVFDWLLDSLDELKSFTADDLSALDSFLSIDGGKEIMMFPILYHYGNKGDQRNYHEFRHSRRGPFRYSKWKDVFMEDIISEWSSLITGVSLPRGAGLQDFVILTVDRQAHPTDKWLIGESLKPLTFRQGQNTEKLYLEVWLKNEIIGKLFLGPLFFGKLLKAVYIQPYRGTDRYLIQFKDLRSV